MKKLFIVADVHGHYYEMWKALNEKGFDINNDDHIFVSCGDLLDRGTKPAECLQYVLSIPKDRRILIRGNHEDMYEDIFNRGYFASHDAHNGATLTFRLLHGDMNERDQKVIIDSVKEHPLLKQYLSETIDCYETEKSVFVHGWIPCYVSYNNAINIEKPNEEDWYDARWINGMKAWHYGSRKDGKTIYCGHWHTSYGHSIIDNKCSEFGEDAIFEPFVKDGIVALDGCVAHTKKVNCYVIEDNIV
jgi:serine/threonine protein phosphatase 1